MYRYNIINALIRKNNYKKYLEIGVRDNHCFNKIQIKDKSGCDPMEKCYFTDAGDDFDVDKVPVKYRMTSDEYFDKYDIKFDIIFIDGLHENEQVYRDIQNSLKCLNEGGTILMHDCLPECEEHQSIPRKSNHWNGDVWKAFVRIRKEREDLDMCVIDTDTGVGVISLSTDKNSKNRYKIEEELELNYEKFDLNRDEWMNIKSPAEFITEVGDEWFKEKRVQAFLHSGNLGDVIWSLPFIIAQGGGDLYLKNSNPLSAVSEQYRNLYKLLKSQPYIRKIVLYGDDYGNKKIHTSGENIGKINPETPVKYDKNIELDYDLDYFRLSPGLRSEHLITSYFRVNNCEMPTTLAMPYLLIDNNFRFKNEKLNDIVEIPKIKYNVFQITQRYRCDFDWGKLINSQTEKNYFVGVKSEYDEIIKDYDVKDKLEHLITKDMYDLALIIKNCNKFYCNPSVGHAIAVASNKEFNLVVHPEQQDVRTGLPTENIIN